MPTDKLGKGLTVSCCVLASVIYLVACKSSPPDLPVTGEVRLQFVQSSQPYMYFRLANQSAHAVSFRGAYVKMGAGPWDSWMECADANSDSWVPGPYPLVDGSRNVVTVESGQQLDVAYGFDFYKTFAQQFPGGRCKLNLKLQGGAIIESDEFRQ